MIYVHTATAPGGEVLKWYSERQESYGVAYLAHSGRWIADRPFSHRIHAMQRSHSFMGESRVLEFSDVRPYQILELPTRAERRRSPFLTNVVVPFLLVLGFGLMFYTCTKQAKADEPTPEEIRALIQAELAKRVPPITCGPTQCPIATLTPTIPPPPRVKDFIDGHPCANCDGDPRPLGRSGDE